MFIASYYLTVLIGRLPIHALKYVLRRPWRLPVAISCIVGSKEKLTICSDKVKIDSMDFTVACRKNGMRASIIN